MAKYNRSSGKQRTSTETRKLAQLAAVNTPTRVIGLKLGRTPAAIALARQMGVTCATEDKDLLKKCPDDAMTMETFTDQGPSLIREKKAKYTARKKVQRIRRVKPFKGKFPLTDKFINAAKREGRA